MRAGDAFSFRARASRWRVGRDRSRPANTARIGHLSTRTAFGLTKLGPFHAAPHRVPQPGKNFQHSESTVRLGRVFCSPSRGRLYDINADGSGIMFFLPYLPGNAGRAALNETREPSLNRMSLKLAPISNPDSVGSRYRTGNGTPGLRFLTARERGDTAWRGGSPVSWNVWLKLAAGRTC